jgi:hypothetical protein
VRTIGEHEPSGIDALTDISLGDHVSFKISFGHSTANPIDL